MHRTTLIDLKGSTYLRTSGPIAFGLPNRPPSLAWALPTHPPRPSPKRRGERRGSTSPCRGGGCGWVGMSVKGGFPPSTTSSGCGGIRTLDPVGFRGRFALMPVPDANALGTALNAVGIALGTLSLAVSAVVFWLSRAGKVRAFESRVYAQLTNAASRIEQIESQWIQEKAATAGLLEEMTNVAQRTAKERRRLYAEHQREPKAPEDGAGGDIALLPREEQLRHVRAALKSV